jgi:hypothetical protein
MNKLKNLAYELLTIEEYSDFISNIDNKDWGLVYMTSYEAYDSAKKELLLLASQDRCDKSIVKNFKSACDFKDKCIKLLESKGIMYRVGST